MITAHTSSISTTDGEVLAEDDSFHAVMAHEGNCQLTVEWTR